MTAVLGINLSAIERVEFFKRDEVTIDLICCDIATDAQTFSYHEEWRGWSALIAQLEELDGFRKDWFSRVSQPPFSECPFVAFQRAEP